MQSISISSNSSSSQWLDAGACALLVQESLLLQRLAGTPQRMPISLPQLQEAWSQLWSTAQQVSIDTRFECCALLVRPWRQLWLLPLRSRSVDCCWKTQRSLLNLFLGSKFLQVAELLEPQHLQHLQRPSSSSGSSSTGTQRQAETLLVLHQLTWLFGAMQAVLQLCSTLDFAAAGSLKQEASEMALDVLRVVSEGCGRPGSASSNHSSSYSAAAAQYACTSAVLGLLAVPGQLSLTEGQTQQLLSVLASLAGQHEGLHAVLAGVLGSLGVTAKSGNQAYQVCVHAP
jgi:hypothetical protein